MSINKKGFKMKQHTLKVFPVLEKERDSRLKADMPVYIVKDGRFFRTAYHPQGWSQTPDYRLGSDGRIYRTKNHPEGSSDQPDYEFGRDSKLYRTISHPKGLSDLPEFKIND